MTELKKTDGDEKARILLATVEAMCRSKSDYQQMEECLKVVEFSLKQTKLPPGFPKKDVLFRLKEIRKLFKVAGSLS